MSFRVSFVLCAFILHSTPALAEPAALDWKSPTTRENAVFCAGLLEFRSGWMTASAMNVDAAIRERLAAEEMVRRYGNNVLVDAQSQNRGYLLAPLRTEPADLTADVEDQSERLRLAFSESGTDRWKPPICMEDEVCAFCWGFLMKMRTAQ